MSILSHPKYRPDIDGLRAIAILAVVFFHAFPKKFIGGFIGVDIFFVISGYLISTIIFENLEKNTFSFSQFYARRIKRIFPALIIVLISCLIFGYFSLLTTELQLVGKHIASGASFILNLVLWQEIGYFDPLAELKPLLHLWSLGIEEQFYIIWPFLLWLTWKKKFNPLYLTLLLTLISLLCSIILTKKDAALAFYFPHTRFWELLAGSLLAWFVLYKKQSYTNLLTTINITLNKIIYNNEKKVDNNIFFNLISLIGLSLLIYGFLTINKDYKFPGTVALIPVIGTILLIAGGNKAWINNKILSHKILVWFGLISFPLYLWHWPLFSYARIITDETPKTKILLLIILCSILLSWLTVKFIEKPFRFGRKYNQYKTYILCICMFMLGSFGMFIYKTNVTKLNTMENVLIKRKGFEHGFGYSLDWFQGKDDWLFLGNNHNNTIAKLKLAILPPPERLTYWYDTLSELAKVGAKINTKIVLLIAPDKHSIYPEYLPDIFIPSKIKYSSFFIDKLKDIPNLTIINPTDYLISKKNTEGLLYGMTDSHWNAKGAYFTYLYMTNILNIPAIQVDFQKDTITNGDLIFISKLVNFPIHQDNTWKVIWKNKPVLTELFNDNQQISSFKIAFGDCFVVTDISHHQIFL